MKNMPDFMIDPATYAAHVRGVITPAEFIAAWKAEDVFKHAPASWALEVANFIDSAP